MTQPRIQAAVAGIGQSSLGRTGRTSLELHATSALAALRDAAIPKQEVDGVLTPYSFMDNTMMHANAFAEYMGINPRYCTTMSSGGTTPFTLLAHAIRAIESGFCETVLIASGDNRASGATRGSMVGRMSGLAHPDYEEPFGPIIPSLYGLIAQRYMHESGCTPEEMASVAVVSRNHAIRNPAAVIRKPLSVQDVLESRMISSPLHLLECCLISDYGGAILVTTEERARDCPNAPIYCVGYGEGHDSQHVTHSELTTAGSVNSGRTAFAQAGLRPSDIDVATIFDSFAITVLILLEDLGLCGRGRAGQFVASGATDLGGALPVNTHGGLLSCSTGGILHLLEVIRQLRGDLGERQVRDARFALAHGDGGVLSSHCTAIFAREPNK